MSLPASWVNIPVTYSGDFYPSGEALAGKRIYVEPIGVVVADGEEATPKAISLTLDENGNLPADTTLPTVGDGVRYRITPKWAGARDAFEVLILTTDTEINLATVAPAAPAEDPVAVSAQASAASASASAAAAEQSAQTASTAAGSIGTAVEDTQVAAAAAALSAETASTAATAAGTSATSAGLAKTASETARDAALAAKGAAETAKTAAETARTAAETAATSAGNSATQAAALIAGTALLRHGTGAPSDALGNDGDYYLDDAAPKTLYGPKAAGAWPAGVSLQGDAGNDGTSATITVYTDESAFNAATPGASELAVLT